MLLASQGYNLESKNEVEPLKQSIGDSKQKMTGNIQDDSH